MEAIGSALSAIVGLLVGIWRWGRNNALQEVNARNENIARIDEMKAAIIKSEKLQDARLDDLVTQFQESFVGLRRQLDNDRLHTEQNFVRKEDFREMLKEIREDMRDIKRSLAEMRSGKA